MFPSPPMKRSCSGPCSSGSGRKSAGSSWRPSTRQAVKISLATGPTACCGPTARARRSPPQRAKRPPTAPAAPAAAIQPAPGARQIAAGPSPPAGKAAPRKRNAGKHDIRPGRAVAPLGRMFYRHNVPQPPRPKACPREQVVLAKADSLYYNESVTVFHWRPPCRPRPKKERELV